MSQVRTLILNRKNIFTLTTFVILIGVATVAPLFHYQAITGPIVNAALFISTILLGLQGAVLVALIPSLIALSVGLLPPVLVPMIPFIMVGNIILIIVFDQLKNKNYWLGMILASIFKFLFLFSTSSIVVNLLLKKEIASKIAMMMGWSQLLTALSGGIIAYLFLKNIRKLDK